MHPIDIEFVFQKSDSLKSMMRVIGKVESYEIKAVPNVLDVVIKVVEAEIVLSLKRESNQNSLDNCKILSPTMCVNYRGIKNIEAKYDSSTKTSTVYLTLIACRLFKDMEDAKTYLVTKELEK